MNKIEEVKKLTNELLKYCHEYYDLDRPTISDTEYDRKYDALKQLEDETGFWLANSPTCKVQGTVLDCFTKVKHSKPMLSAAKTKDINEIKKFVGSNDFYCSYKLDGLTMVTRYENGKFVQAITRGNGQIGEDVTAQAKMISNLPMSIPYDKPLELRGECVISWSNFYKTNVALDEPYSHPRNLAAGSLRNLDTNVTKNRHLSYVVFECISDLKDIDGLMDSKELTLRWLDMIGFETVGRCWGTIDNCIEAMQPEYYEYPVDGLIFEFDNKLYSKSLSATSHHEGCRMALKWADDTYDTTLCDIEWTVGRTGILTPTAVFKPVEIDGTIVERASLHNVSIMKNIMKGAYKGQRIKVYKANMIIPQLSWADDKYDGVSEMIYFPTECPACGGKTVIKRDNETEVLVCTNPNCTAKQLAKFTHFVSRNCANIEGLSEKTLETLISHGFLHSFKDIYHLFEYKEQLIKLDGLGEKSVSTLLKSIEKSRDIKLENFINAFGISNIGLSASNTLAEYCNGDIYGFFNLYFNDFDWTKLSNFGDTMAKNMEEYLYNHIADVEELADEMHFIVEEKVEIKENPFIGKSICVTGKLEHFTRDSINAKITELGAKVASGVTAKTDYLVTNTPDSGSSKNVNAKKFGTKIITESEFLQMIGE